MHNGQSGQAVVKTNQAYIAEFDRSVQPAAPVLDTLEPGLRIQVMPVITADRKYVVLKIQAEHLILHEIVTTEDSVEVDGKIQAVELPLTTTAAWHKITVQQPEQSTFAYLATEVTTNSDTIDTATTAQSCSSNPRSLCPAMKARFSTQAWSSEPQDQGSKFQSVLLSFDG